MCCELLTKQLTIIMEHYYKEGDVVMIPPEITGKQQWERGVVIETEENPWRGAVITAQTQEGDVYFDVSSSFKPAN